MTGYNDERDDLFELKQDLGKIFAEERNALVFDPMRLAEKTQNTVTGFFNFNAADGLVDVKINPFARKATVTVHPTDASALSLSLELKDMVKAGMRFTIRF